MRNLKLDICYDGTRYRGWQRLGSTDNTVQQKLETALSRILGEEIQISGSGRTDAGTHAKHQIANFHCAGAMPADKIAEELRRYLPEDIGIYSCTEASERFHARLNAKSKTYCYRVWNSEVPCVFERKYVYIAEERLDVKAMEHAAQMFLGTHDFGAFCATKKTDKSTVRTVESFRVQRVDNEIRFTVTGNGFLHHMVRIMVGTLLEVGSGKRKAETVPILFEAKRCDAGALIPACGLCLMEVTY